MSAEFRAIASADVLLVHLPCAGEVLPRINLMAMGLVSIAAELDAHGFSTSILHEGVEQALDPDFSLAEHLRGAPVKLLGLSLQWHQQASRTLEVARAVKAARPDLVIVLGGFTASRFAEELLADHPAVDFVIRGDAERGMRELSERLLGRVERPLGAIANLVYRDAEGTPRVSAVRHQVGSEESRALSFTRFDLVHGADRYLALRMDTAPLGAEKSFSFSAGRGCEAACLYCAGGRAVQRKYSHRAETVLFPPDHVVEQLVQIRAQGATRWSTCFDPVPESDYYLELFRQIRARGVELTLVFDCFGLPTRAFVDAAARTFQPGSALNISPETGSEALRRRIKTFTYDNDALIARAQEILARGLGCGLYFSTGFPFETREDLVATLELIARVRAEAPGAHVYVGIIDLEPGSPLFDHQARLGIESEIHDLATLLAAQATPREVNYRTRDFSTREILDHAELLRREAACTTPARPMTAWLREARARGLLAGNLLERAEEACRPCARHGACHPTRAETGAPSLRVEPRAATP